MSHNYEPSNPPSDCDGKDPSITRKSFLATIAAVAWLSSVALAMMGSIRSLIPSVLPDPSLRFRIGGMGDFSPGISKAFEDENVAVFCDEDGIYAISLVCTHLGCTVRQTPEGFHCPCHGSVYDFDGRVTQGPAPKSLEWYGIAKTPGGQLVVDRTKPVAAGTRIEFGVEDA